MHSKPLIISNLSTEPRNYLTAEALTGIPPSPPPLPTSARLRVTHIRNGDREVDTVRVHELGDLHDRRLGRHVCLSWESRPRTVLVVATRHSRPALTALPIVVAHLRHLSGITVLVETDAMAKVVEAAAGVGAGAGAGVPTAGSGGGGGGYPAAVAVARRKSLTCPAIADEVDFVICLGGDGLILHVVSELFPKAVPPLMPFNMGSLGFLTPFDLSAHRAEISRVVKGENKPVTMRMRLKCVIVPKAAAAVLTPASASFPPAQSATPSPQIAAHSLASPAAAATPAAPAAVATSPPTPSSARPPSQYQVASRHSGHGSSHAVPPSPTIDHPAGKPNSCAAVLASPMLTSVSSSGGLRGGGECCASSGDGDYGGSGDGGGRGRRSGSGHGDSGAGYGASVVDSLPCGSTSVSANGDESAEAAAAGVRATADALASLVTHHVLNEIVIDRGPTSYLSNLEVLADDCPVTRVQADGLIIATPTGSTAYSLSSNGSMVHPDVPAILFTPICPHSLSFRPVLFPQDAVLQIKVPEDARASAWVSFDGRHRRELQRGDKVVVCASRYPVPTFCRKDSTRDWFASVSQCLRWNERVVQAPMAAAAYEDAEEDDGELGGSDPGNVLSSVDDAQTLGSAQSVGADLAATDTNGVGPDMAALRLNDR